MNLAALAVIGIAIGIWLGTVATRGLPGRAGSDPAEERDGQSAIIGALVAR